EASEVIPGTNTGDRSCLSGWIQQFGTWNDDQALDVAFDSNGNVVVVGFTGSELPGHTQVGYYDAFVRLIGSDGTVSWSRQLGTTLDDEARSVAVDNDGNILIAGMTNGEFPGYENAAAVERSFVMKLDPA